MSQAPEDHHDGKDSRPAAVAPSAGRSHSAAATGPDGGRQLLLFEPAPEELATFDPSADGLPDPRRDATSPAPSEDDARAARTTPAGQPGADAPVPSADGADPPPQATAPDHPRRTRRASTTLTPAQRVLRARIGAYHLHATRDPTETTRKAREAFAARFERQVDPEGILPSDERARRAEAARRAHFTALALRSSVARRRRRSG